MVREIRNEQQLRKAAEDGFFEPVVFQVVGADEVVMVYGLTITVSDGKFSQAEEYNTLPELIDCLVEGYEFDLKKLKKMG